MNSTEYSQNIYDTAQALINYYESCEFQLTQSTVYPVNTRLSTIKLKMHINSLKLALEGKS